MSGQHISFGHVGGNLSVGDIAQTMSTSEREKVQEALAPIEEHKETPEEITIDTIVDAVQSIGLLPHGVALLSQALQYVKTLL